MVATAAKRKKTAEMPDSPPKRVTRARAAKETDDPAAVQIKTTRITTASSKAAAARKKTASTAKEPEPAKPSKRKARADNEKTETQEEPAAVESVQEEPAVKPVKAKGRQKKVAVGDNPEAQHVEAPKTRGRQPTNARTETVNTEAAKTRGRPKRGVDEVIAEPLTDAAQNEPAPAKKSTRGRAAAPAKSSVTAAVTKPKIPVARKKVTFEESTDKENIPIEVQGPKKAASKPTGLKAKPVRKPAGARATTRGRAVTRGATSKAEESKKEVVMPLSPKKVNQVAKSDPISEDELLGERTPIRALSKSPTKRILSPIKDMGAMPQPNFGQEVPPSSPTKPVSSIIMTSPARRPPQSPFKDSLKNSPKKPVDLNAFAQPMLLPSRTPMKASLLHQSPKRGMIVDSAVKPVLTSSQASFKSSLLQSPARRPQASPMKSTRKQSPTNVGSSSSDLDATMSLKMLSPVKAKTMRASPEKVISSPLRATKSPERGFRVHTMTDEERKTSHVNERSEQRPEPVVDDMDSLLQSVPDEQVPVEKQAKSDEAMPVDTPNLNEDGVATADDTMTQDLVTVEVAPRFTFGSSALRRTTIGSELSEDELASPHKFDKRTPLRRYGISDRDFETPAVIQSDIANAGNGDLSFTPLADQLNSWNASSPQKQGQSRRTRGLFSLGGAMIPAPEEVASVAVDGSPAKSSFFEDQMIMREEEDQSSDTEVIRVDDQNLEALQTSMDSQASEEYGDENAAPNDLELLRVEQDTDQTITCTPAKVFTPARVIQRPQEMHTVCKVPLRPSAEDSPLRVPRQRSRSFGGPLAPVIAPKIPRTAQHAGVQPATPVLAPALAPQTPSSNIKLDAETPGRTVRKGVVPDVLKGAVVHVDVHTTEGADASGIFVDLLTQMGARCIKQWNWNPRASLGGSLNNTGSPQGNSPDVTANKPGITHVVYKDGGKRTLEKVASSNGAVLCVGVGWVLDCEREDKWLDEADYAVDTSIIPRGGGRRRKSMEPRALANLNGNLVPAGSETPAPAKPVANEMSPTEEFLTFDTPASRRDSFIIDPAQTHVAIATPAPATPVASSVDNNMLEDGSMVGSPTTPYYLSKGAALVQQTCPPKQMGPMSLFPITGDVEDQPDESVRRKLLEARRKSLQFSSRVKSPLGRTVSYGK